MTADRECVALIEEHLPVLFDMARDARMNGRSVQSWTLPAHWDPGSPSDSPVTRVYGRPVTFEGTALVAHLSGGAEMRRAPSDHQHYWRRATVVDAHGHHMLGRACDCGMETVGEPYGINMALVRAGQRFNDAVGTSLAAFGRAMQESRKRRMGP